MVLDPIPQSLTVHFFGSRPQPPTTRLRPRNEISQKSALPSFFHSAFSHEHTKNTHITHTLLRMFTFTEHSKMQPSAEAGDRFVADKSLSKVKKMSALRQKSKSQLSDSFGKSQKNVSSQKYDKSQKSLKSQLAVQFAMGWLRSVGSLK